MNVSDQHWSLVVTFSFELSPLRPPVKKAKLLGASRETDKGITIKANYRALFHILLCLISQSDALKTVKLFKQT